MEPLEPWLDRTILRTVASFCSSYSSDLKQIYSLNHIVLEYIPTRKQISTVKEFEKQKKKKKATLPVWIMTMLCLDRSILIFSFYFFWLLKNVFLLLLCPFVSLAFLSLGCFYVSDFFSLYPFSFICFLSLGCFLAFRFVVDS